MSDIVSQEKRSEMMSGIKGKNTKPEIIVRKELFKRGFRYRLHDKKLAGKPDLVLPKYKAAIFVNGCFWHGHDCKLFKWPKSNPEFWKEKITKNKERDVKNRKLLEEQGWRVTIIWECAVKGKLSDNIRKEVDTLSDWLTGTQNK
jgi:DNA mismatch endonuclease, patch repair protein